MNLLPKNFKEFSNREYWEAFFNKLDKKNSENEFFEWYGGYADYANLLKINGILKPSSRILNLGCGNSLFSEHMYDDGFTSIVNIDFSEKAIKKMSKRSEKKRPLMKYLLMDIFDLKFEKEQFEVIVDKGGIDAIFSEETMENDQKIKTLFQSISDMLSPLGYYICISLLQDFILKCFLDYFYSPQYTIHIYEMNIENWKYMPFMVAIMKNKESCEPSIYLHLVSDKLAPKLVTREQSQSVLNSLQFQRNYLQDMKNLRPGKRFTMEIGEVNSKALARYTIYVVDSESKKTLSQNTCGCFITPQGKESQYLFSTAKGNTELLNQTGLSRLVIVIMNPGHVFSSLKQVQDELSPVILQLCPKNCSNMPCPFMTDGGDLGERIILFESEEFLVEEVKGDEEDQVVRRLMMKNNVNVIQSQFKLSLKKDEAVKSKSFDKSFLKETSELKLNIDEGNLEYDYAKLIVAGLAIMPANEPKESRKLMLLGGGLNVIGKFLHRHFSDLSIESVEKSAVISKLAEEYFNVPCDERFKSIVSDARSYILSLEKELAAKAEACKLNEGEQGEEEETKANEPKKEVKQCFAMYEMIIIDIISEQFGEISPPKELLETEFLSKIKSLLKPEGILTLNVLVGNDKELKEVIKKLSTVFDLIYKGGCDNDANYVLYAVNIDFAKEKKKDVHNKDEEILTVNPEKLLDKKALEKRFKELQKASDKKWDATLNLESFVQELSLEYPKYNSNPFERKNIQILKENSEETSNNTKDMYLSDKSKIEKNKKKKKRKNKAK